MPTMQARERDTHTHNYARAVFKGGGGGGGIPPPPACKVYTSHKLPPPPLLSVPQICPSIQPTLIHTKMAVMRAPLLGGERKPKQAKMRASCDMRRICVPELTQTDSNMIAVGGRNTSPWTSFQPKSSWMSSYSTCTCDNMHVHDTHACNISHMHVHVTHACNISHIHVHFTHACNMSYVTLTVASAWL